MLNLTVCVDSLQLDVAYVYNVFKQYRIGLDSGRKIKHCHSYNVSIEITKMCSYLYFSTVYFMSVSEKENREKVFEILGL
jgi:hypothetical protein